MRTLTLCLLTLSATMSVPAVASAHESYLAAMSREVFAPLGLSAEQKAALKDLYQRKRENGRALRLEMWNAGHELAAALTGDTTDDKLTALHVRYDKARDAIADYRFQGLLEVRKILTPEQRGRFGELYIAFRQARTGARGQE